MLSTVTSSHSVNAQTDRIENYQRDEPLGMPAVDYLDYSSWYGTPILIVPETIPWAGDLRQYKMKNAS